MRVVQAHVFQVLIKFCLFALVQKCCLSNADLTACLETLMKEQLHYPNTYINVYVLAGNKLAFKINGPFYSYFYLRWAFQTKLLFAKRKDSNGWVLRTGTKLVPDPDCQC